MLKSEFINQQTKNSCLQVVLVGGPDVDARFELMRALEEHFDMGAAGSDHRLFNRFTQEKFSFHYYPLSRRVDPISDLRSLVQLVAYFRRLKPQIVHTFDTKPNVWGRLAARIAGVPVVIGTVTGIGSLYNTSGLKNKLTWAIYQGLQTFVSRYSDATIFQNHGDFEVFTRAKIVAAEKSQIILGSGVSTENYNPEKISEDDKSLLRAELGIPKGYKVVTMVSRVIRTKGVLEFATAAQIVLANDPQTHFLLVGPEDEDSIDRLSPQEMTQLRQMVNYVGPRRDIPTVLSISDVFVLPSAYHEGIPRVLLEAASMGVPIVTTDSPGCNEVVVDGLNGFLIAVGDTDNLAQKIGNLVRQPRLCQRFGAASRKRAVECFALPLVAEQLHVLYQSLLDKKNQ